MNELKVTGLVEGSWVRALPWSDALINWAASMLIYVGNQFFKSTILIVLRKKQIQMVLGTIKKGLSKLGYEKRREGDT